MWLNKSNPEENFLAEELPAWLKGLLPTLCNAFNKAPKEDQKD